MRIRERFNPHAPFEARRGGRLAPASNDRFNPRTPCGARQRGRKGHHGQGGISTHAPLAGRDGDHGLQVRPLDAFQPTRPLRGATCISRRSSARRSGFQPTRPLRGATGTSSKTRGQGNISTHAPLAGRDMTTQRQKNHGQTNFNPRAPCGARPFAPSGINSGIRFQPTRPLRGATAWEAVDMASDGISTHAPLAGRDEMVQDTPVEGVISTHAPLAGRDGAADRSARGERISTHAPLAGRDRPAKLHQSRRGISTHAPLAGRDSKSVQITMHIFAITDKFQMLLHRMPPVRAFCSFLMQENHADFGCEPPK